MKENNEVKMGKYFEKLIDLKVKEKKTIFMVDEWEKQSEKTKSKLFVFTIDSFFIFLMLLCFIFIQKFANINIFGLGFDTLNIIFYSIIAIVSVIVSIRLNTHYKNNKKTKKRLSISRRKQILAENKKLNFLTKNIDSLYAEIENGEISDTSKNEEMIEIILIRKKNELKKQLPKIEGSLSKNEKLIREIKYLNKEVLSINTY